MSEASITLKDVNETIALFGARDQYLRQIRDALPIRVIARNGLISLEGDPDHVTRATQIFTQLRRLIHDHGAITPADVTTVLESTQPGVEPALPASDIVQSKRRVRPRSEGQSRYVQAMRESDLVLCIGPAGTGKTYLAVAAAVNALLREQIRKIVLVRPAVEAGEKLGFLPGDIVAKVNPYLRPLLDALHDMLEYDQIKRYMEADLIEIIPLAFMRGRTLNEAFIILDEGQNTTVPQMKMFLTRMGHGSKIVVTGDITQVDLPSHTRNGLSDAAGRLGKIKGVEIVRLSQKDIVRHRLVQEIVEAYQDDKSSRSR
jgi:phosphate starvation-inducible protein PhoH and related proteins